MLDKLSELRGRFPRVYWISLTFEMMERGAYYSMMPIIAIHAIYNLGFDEWLGAMVTAFMYPFQYGLPIFTGALAEKVGYKRQMIFAFTFLTIAYFFLSYAYNIPTMILAVMAVGVGIGSYKPLISATVAKCTVDADRNLAYGIYYWIVNLAAFLFPLIFVFAMWGGILSRGSFYVVFMIGGIMVAVNILTAIFTFEEVPRSGKVKTVGDAVNNVRTAFADKKFVVMVVLIGGFWALYSTMLYGLPVIIFGYRWAPWFFNEMLLGVFNPLTIIALGPFISKYFEKIESMRVILAGLTIYLIGLAILGFFIQQWTIVIIGILIVSIGEFMVAPGYLSFISKLAPKEKISAYIGCNFISYMIGLLGGTIVFSLVLDAVGVNLQRPNLFYGILISFGLVLLFTFIIYYKTWGQDVIARAKKIREQEEGYKEDIIPSDYKEPFIFRIFDNKITNIIPLLIIPIILFATFSMGTYNYIGPPEEEEEKPVPLVWASIQDTNSGASDENSYSDVIINITEDKMVVWFNCTLTWRDEGSSYPLGTNEPDDLKVAIIAPNDEIVKESSLTSNPQGGEGQITINSPELDIDQDDFKEKYVGDWIIRVEAGDCGDDYARPNLFGIVRSTSDTGNNWDLNYEFTFLTPKE
jgi:MFS family permease